MSREIVANGERPLVRESGHSAEVLLRPDEDTPAVIVMEFGDEDGTDSFEVRDVEFELRDVEVAAVPPELNASFAEAHDP